MAVGEPIAATAGRSADRERRIVQPASAVTQPSAVEGRHAAQRIGATGLGCTFASPVAHFVEFGSDLLPTDMQARALVAS